MSLVEIQNKLKAPKNQVNEFGGYRYRSCEDILNAVKPLLYEYHNTINLTDEVVPIGNRVYVKAKAVLKDETGRVIEKSAGWAREAESRKGYDEAQLTGASSSYARKYALNGLLAIDDERDADAMKIDRSLKEVDRSPKVPEKTPEKIPEKKEFPKQENKLVSEAQLNAIHAQLNTYGIAEFRDEFKHYLRCLGLIKESMKELSMSNASHILGNFSKYFVRMMCMETMQSTYIDKFKSLKEDKKRQTLLHLSKQINDLENFDVESIKVMEGEKLHEVFSLFLKGLSNQEHNKIVDEYDNGSIAIDDAIDVLDGLGMEPKVVDRIIPTAPVEKKETKKSFF